MPEIELLTSATPNGQKISILLEELAIPYKATPINLRADEQKSPDFLSINPNGRIPAIIDHSRNDFPVFESGAIFLYLVEHYDKEKKFSFDDADEKSEMIQWLFFQNAGVGRRTSIVIPIPSIPASRSTSLIIDDMHMFSYIPRVVYTNKTPPAIQGQANHFFRYAPTKIPYSISRYQNETRRLYSVLESRLSSQTNPDRKFLAGKGAGKYSVADISTFTWVRWAPWAGIDLSKFPRLKGWMEGIERREAVQRGLLVPGGEDQIVRLRRDPDVEDPFKGWVMKGQNEIKDKHGD
jgi:glutathione S-transferase